MTNTFNNYSKKTLVFLIAMIFVSAPSFALADSNGKGKGNSRNVDIKELREQKKLDKKQEQFERKQGRSFELEIEIEDENSDDDDDNDGNDNGRNGKGEKCLRAFGHLIAPGWIKNNGDIDWNDFKENCFIPFGIAKRGFDWQPGTTTKDVIAPTISSITVRKSDTQAVIRWNTDEPSDSNVYYSLTTNFDKGASTTIKVSDGSLQSFHRVLLTGLTPETTYYVKVSSSDLSDNESTSGEFSFVTDATPAPLDTTPPVISNISGNVSTSSVSVTWTTDEPSTSKVYYSETLPIDISTTTTPMVGNDSLTTDHALSINGLATSTLYYLLVSSVDSSGNIATSTTFSTTTASEI